MTCHNEMEHVNPATIMQKVEQLASANAHASHPWWPGFEPRKIPVAVFDGQRTWLFNHPHPSAEWRQHRDHAYTKLGETPSTVKSINKSVEAIRATITDTKTAAFGMFYAYDGLHPTIRGNSFIDLDGVATATVMLTAVRRQSLSELAAIVIHEMFHVYQQQHHPEWCSDTMEMFVYPAPDQQSLKLRRLETEALRRAIQANEQMESRAWCRTAMALRAHRFERLPQGSVQFERGTELLEGLAQYVELRALGQTTVPIPVAEFAPEAVRSRCYTIGTALAFLLDRHRPQWKDTLNTERFRSLDQLLRDTCTSYSGDAAIFTEAEDTHADRQAANDIAVWHRRCSEARRQFATQSGWQCTVEIVSASSTGGVEPLRVTSFDPQNVQKLSSKEIRHNRHLRLVNGACELDMIDGQALTVSAGDHPLFDGILQVTFSGLTEKPILESKDGLLTFRADGLTGKICETDHVRMTMKYNSEQTND
ncbi:hypothetical protein [Numidum massiliense]|uniref:hypothetical protein n=1 Tax=Numidum massiliense TaxID=1522315 RepID=UPI0006D5A5CA|nr:hypothetical protein [Numidum massiliense]